MISYPTNKDTREDGEIVSIDPLLGEFITYLAGGLPDTLRHSFATNLLQSNTNLYHVSKMLGHAQLTTTQQYLHVIDEDLRKVYNKHHTY